MKAKDYPNDSAGVPMVFPAWLVPYELAYLNPAFKRVGRYLPGTAIIKHRGRKSGKQYETIVTAYLKGGAVTIVLGHGKTDWVKNVLVAGEADVSFTRGEVRITNPRILPAGSEGEGLPWLPRRLLRRMAVFVSDIA